MDEEMLCPECGATHRDGDKIEVLTGARSIRVKCFTHAVWARRRTLQGLLGSWKLSPRMVAAFRQAAIGRTDESGR
jgi:hypothetical protein